MCVGTTTGQASALKIGCRLDLSVVEDEGRVEIVTMLEYEVQIVRLVREL